MKSCSFSLSPAGVSGARVMRPIDLLQSLLDHVRVDLRGRDIGMAQHHLYGPQIGPTIEQMSRKTMAQHMGRQSLPQPRLATVVPKRLPKRNASDLAARLI